MKSIQRIFTLILGIGLLQSSEASASSYLLTQNGYAMSESTETYLSSALTTKDIRQILGLVANPANDFEQTRSIDGRQLLPLDMLKNVVAYVVTIEAVLPREPWPNLAEKRYSITRDLLSYLSDMSMYFAGDHIWAAPDLKLKDGHIFLLES